MTTREQSHDDLALARDHLARAESALVTEEGLNHLQEGLAHLEAIIDGKPGAQRESVARNLGQTYTSRIYEYIGREIDKNRSLTEPELEHFFAVIRAFDDACFDLPPHASRLKVDIVRRLIDLYYDGYSASEKEEVFKKLAEVSGDLKT